MYIPNYRILPGPTKLSTGVPTRHYRNMQVVMTRLKKFLSAASWESPNPNVTGGTMIETIVGMQSPIEELKIAYIMVDEPSEKPKSPIR